MKDICAVIVTYNPNPAEVQTLVERIAEHVGLIVIVDNGSRNVAALLTLPVRLIELGSNKGVATAQNVGIQAALERDYKFVLLFDQDSLPEPDMVPKLREAFDSLTNQGVRVAAVAANYRERNSGLLAKPNNQGCMNVGHAISSGCLYSADALRDVGPMMDDLFIDYVDTEWCMRAIRKHRIHRFRIETMNCWKIYIVGDAIMGHTWSHGIGRFHIGWKVVIAPYYPPIRHYYMFRNAAYLYLRSDYSIRWKFIDFTHRVALFVLAIIGAFPEGRWPYLRMMFLGVWHGLINRMGKLEETASPLLEERNAETQWCWHCGEYHLSTIPHRPPLEKRPVETQADSSD
jgi:rhamnosyltransferase